KGKAVSHANEESSVRSSFSKLVEVDNVFDISVNGIRGQRLQLEHVKETLAFLKPLLFIVSVQICESRAGGQNV
ncbi:UNVERIFIED_CONTAM: hypothetical protein NY603_34130, partial [Bacteroidetes bacterium 56_B9]